jgi:hypothetical protein
MKFAIRRTSEWEDRISPCEGAVQLPYIRIDERTVNDPMKNKYIGEDWYKEGTNHRVENGHIKRDFEEKCWFIEIETLEDLMNLRNREGQPLIIDSSNNNPNIPQIEIYDNYRE